MMKPVPTNTVPFFWHIPAQKPEKKLNPPTTKILSISINKKYLRWVRQMLDYKPSTQKPTVMIMKTFVYTQERIQTPVMCHNYVFLFYFCILCHGTDSCFLSSLYKFSSLVQPTSFTLWQQRRLLFVVPCSLSCVTDAMWVSVVSTGNSVSHSRWLEA